MDILDFVKYMFNKEQWSQVPDNWKKKHAFVAHRFVSINFPIIAATYNYNGINVVALMNMYHKILSRKYNSIPRWIYTGTDKVDKFKDEVSKFSNPLIKEYITSNKMTRKQFMDMRELFPTELAESIKEFDKENKK